MKLARLLPLVLVATGAPTLAAAQNLLTNGGFETPVVPPLDPNDILTFNTGANFGGWVVGAGNVEILDGDRIQPSEGDQSLDLNGVQIGTIYQDVATVLGGEYDLTFALAGNPFRSSDKTLNVLWGLPGGPLGVVGAFTFVWSPTQGAFDMQWSSRGIAGLVATGTTMRLAFQSTTPTTDAGPFLDDISLVAVSSVPEPATVALMAAGLVALGGVARSRRR